MSYENRNRGKESNDIKLFGAKAQIALKEALDDYCFLLTRGYAQRSSVQLVGNRYRLNARQQQVLMNMGASEQQSQLRTNNSVNPADISGKKIEIDGFNLLIILESLLSEAFVFKGRDGFYRDISSVHGSYKRVSKTENALLLIGNYLNSLTPSEVLWIFDAPVSNSGRLKSFLISIAEEQNWNWTVILDNNPDKMLAESKSIVVSSDAWVLDHAQRIFNMVHYLLAFINNHEFIVNV